MGLIFGRAYYRNDLFLGGLLLEFYGISKQEKHTEAETSIDGGGNWKRKTRVVGSSVTALEW